jgi:hypothetical protein
LILTGPPGRRGQIPNFAVFAALLKIRLRGLRLGAASGVPQRSLKILPWYFALLDFTGLTVFVKVGNALLEIRDSRLYRQQFPTFEAYCRERWGMGRNYPNRLIQAAEVVKNLVPIGTIPQTETQARPLTRLEPEVQQVVWKAVHRATVAR